MDKSDLKQTGFKSFKKNFGGGQFWIDYKFTRCVTSGKLLNISVTQIPHL